MCKICKRQYVDLNLQLSLLSLIVVISPFNITKYAAFYGIFIKVGHGSDVFSHHKSPQCNVCVSTEDSGCLHSHQCLNRQQPFLKNCSQTQGIKHKFYVILIKSSNLTASIVFTVCCGFSLKRLKLFLCELCNQCVDSVPPHPTPPPPTLPCLAHEKSQPRENWSQFSCHTL